MVNGLFFTKLFTFAPDCIKTGYCNCDNAFQTLVYNNYMSSTSLDIYKNDTDHKQ